MVSRIIATQYLKSGKKLILLRGKVPISPAWNTSSVSEEEVFKHKDNLGWALGNGDLVIDVDPKNGGDKSYERLVKYLKAEDPTIILEPTVTTPSGGFHIYLSVPDSHLDTKLRKNLNAEFPGIDFLTKGHQCVIVESRTPKGEYAWADDLLGCFMQSEAPKALLNLLSYSAQSVGEMGDFEGLVSFSQWTEDDVLELLSRLDPSMPNSEWVKVGMALHDWHAKDGLRLWEEWSQGGSNYQAGETDKRWRSFKPDGGVTLGSLTYMAKVADYTSSNDRVQHYLDKIDTGSEQTIQVELSPAMKRENFNDLQREKLATAIQKRILKLTDTKLPISKARTMVTPAYEAGQLMTDSDRPAWVKPYVYAVSHKAFFHVLNLQPMKAEAFNLFNGIHIPASEGGSKVAAVKYVSDRGYIKKVDTLAYLPTIDTPVVKIENITYLNTYSPASVPVETKIHSEEGLEFIEAVRRHTRFICGSDENTEILLQWIAHQVQFPGRKILWSPIIQGKQGVGKSFYGEFLRACLGDRNVGVVGPTQVSSDFNAWATGSAVNVLEELRVKGHNRHDAVNALKPLITDRMIQVNDKHVTPFTTYNTCNYLCFTNYKDCLPLEDDDRRWWVIFTPLSHISELEEEMGQSSNEYFPRMFDGIRKHGGELRKWMLDYPLTEEFLALKRAPMTEHKEAMIATERESYEGLNELDDLIDEGGIGFCSTVVSSRHLFDAMLMKPPHMAFQTRQRSDMLKRLGFTALPKPVKMDGETLRIWTRKPMTNDEARNILINIKAKKDYDL